MASSVIHEHNGVRFTVEAVPHGEVFAGRFSILGSLRGDASSASGDDDTYRPTMDNAWATEAEALTYATEAAHHAIEGIPPVTAPARIV